MRNLTAHQAEILKVIVRGNLDGSFVDLDQLIERLSYKPKKAALQFSLRFMIQRELIQKQPLELRRGVQRRSYSPTSEGYAWYRELLRS